MKELNLDYKTLQHYSPLYETALLDDQVRLPSEVLLSMLEELYEQHGFCVSPIGWLDCENIYPVQELQSVASSLAEALVLFRQGMATIGSEANLNIKLKDNDVVEFEFYRNPVIITPLRSFAVGQWLVFSLLIRVIELYRRAKPLCLSFTGPEYVHEDVKIRFEDIPILFEQQKIAVYFSNEDLQLSDDFFNELNPNYHSEWELREFIRELAPGHFVSKRVTGESLAHALGISSRHLNRRLSAEGLSLRDILSELKITQAKVLLEEFNVSVAEISKQLGYSTSGHFIRAFRNFTGLTPKVYREHLKGKR